MRAGRPPIPRVPRDLYPASLVHEGCNLYPANRMGTRAYSIIVRWDAGGEPELDFYAGPPPAKCQVVQTSARSNINSLQCNLVPPLPAALV